MKTETFGRITLYNADCMDVMREMPDKAFDLTIVDPPYGININMNMGRRKGKKKMYDEKEWDNQIPHQAYFDELFRISSNQIIWGGNYFPLPSTGAWIFWDKGTPEGVSFADGELAWTSFNGTLKKARIVYAGFRGKDSDGRIHPTQKPVALYKWLLSKYAKQGDKILDTHLGSGSICIACDDLGFDMTGIELDPDYYNAAKKRIINHQAQQKLF